MFEDNGRVKLVGYAIFMSACRTNFISLIWMNFYDRVKLVGCAIPVPSRSFFIFNWTYFNKLAKLANHAMLMLLHLLFLSRMVLLTSLKSP